jgi:hypothetical protein
VYGLQDWVENYNGSLKVITPVHSAGYLLCVCVCERERAGRIRVYGLGYWVGNYSGDFVGN